MDSSQLPPPPPSIPPYATFLKFWMLSIMLSAICYGVAFTLFWACLTLLKASPRRPSVPTTKRTRVVLILYSITMIVLSTASLISSIIMVTNAIFTTSPFYGDILGNTGTICIVFSNWGTDGFLLSRCLLLYEGISIIRRRTIIVAVTVLSLMSIVVGMTCLVTGSMNADISSECLFAFACTSLFVNIVITCLIVARLLYFIRRIKAALGSASISIYTNIIAMLVESAALTIVFGASYLVLTLALPVIAPLLIIYRVGHGKAWSNETTSLHTLDKEMDSRRQMASLRFADVNQPPRLPMLPITVTGALSLENIEWKDESRLK